MIIYIKPKESKCLDIAEPFGKTEYLKSLINILPPKGFRGKTNGKNILYYFLTK